MSRDTAIVDAAQPLLKMATNETKRYPEEFWRLKCGPDLLNTGYFPNFKEVTESLAAYRAYWRFLRSDFPPGKPTTCVVIADGRHPRTGAVFAFRTSWVVISIDPQIEIQNEATHSHGVYYKDNKVRRLFRVKEKAEELFNYGFAGIEDSVLCIAVHSHAKLDCIQPWRDPLICKDMAVISIECCIEQKIDGWEPFFIYEDLGCFSPKRTVKIWKEHHAS